MVMAYPNKLIICRVCLSVDIKMYSIANTLLHPRFETLTGKKLQTNDARPDTICYICYAQLQKFDRFIDMTHRSDKQVMRMLKHFDLKLTQTTLSTWKRRPHNFFVCKYPNIDIKSQSDTDPFAQCDPFADCEFIPETEEPRSLRQSDSSDSDAVENEADNIVNDEMEVIDEVGTAKDNFFIVENDNMAVIKVDTPKTYGKPNTNRNIGTINFPDDKLSHRSKLTFHNYETDNIVNDEMEVIHEVGTAKDNFFVVENDNMAVIKVDTPKTYGKPNTNRNIGTINFPDDKLSHRSKLTFHNYEIASVTDYNFDSNVKVRANVETDSNQTIGNAATDVHITKVIAASDLLQKRKAAPIANILKSKVQRSVLHDKNGTGTQAKQPITSSLSSISVPRYVKNTLNKNDSKPLSNLSIVLHKGKPVLANSISQEKIFAQEFIKKHFKKKYAISLICNECQEIYNDIKVFKAHFNKLHWLVTKGVDPVFGKNYSKIFIELKSTEKTELQANDKFGNKLKNSIDDDMYENSNKKQSDSPEENITTSQVTEVRELEDETSNLSSNSRDSSKKLRNLENVSKSHENQKSIMEKAVIELEDETTDINPEPRRLRNDKNVEKQLSTTVAIEDIDFEDNSSTDCTTLYLEDELGYIINNSEEHTVVEGTNYQCTGCGTLFNDIAIMEDHIKYLETPLSCNYCDLKFRTKCFLRVHCHVVL